MDPAAVPRSIAKLQYAAVRLPFTVLEERVVARHRGDGAFVHYRHPVRQIHQNLPV